jgi:unsaturated chondroitin disaccharide hydrolase
MYRGTGYQSFRLSAEKWTAGLEEQQFNTSTHDVGFMTYCSYGNGYRVEPKEGYKKILLQAAKSLSARFSPTVGCIRSWDNRKGGVSGHS